MKKGVEKFGGRGRKAVFLQPFRSKTQRAEVWRGNRESRGTERVTKSVEDSELRKTLKFFQKKVAKKFGGYKNLQYFCTRFRQGSHTRVTESKK